MMGVATGIVMEFEFGTNWSTYSRYVGDVFGSALAAEGVFAFFLECLNTRGFHFLTSAITQNGHSEVETQSKCRCRIRHSCRA